jgi:hypothetical protein
VEATPKQDWFEATSINTKSSDRKSDGNTMVPLDATQWNKLVHKWQVLSILVLSNTKAAWEPS